MELAEKLRKIMAEEFGIRTDDDLIKALDQMDESVFAVFIPEKEVVNE